jgi:hypothetical protein
LSLSLRLLAQNTVCTLRLPHTCHMPSPLHSSWLVHPKNIRRRGQIMTLVAVPFSALSPGTPSWAQTSTSAPHPQAPLGGWCLNVRDQVSHPYSSE